MISQISKERNKKINKVEKLKPTSTPSEAMSRLREYAKSGYDSIKDEDKSLFFKYFGIFDKFKSNGANHFMLRIRIPAGQMSATQAKKVGELALKYANNYIDITTRMQLEFRYLKIEDLPTVIDELESVGITTYQTGIDNLRNIVTDPLDGLSSDNVIETKSLINKMQEIFLKQDSWIGTLPRKFNTSISGSYANRCNVFGHDCSFALAQKDGEFGFNVYLGGRVGNLAKSADIFVRSDEVVPFFKALIEIFKEFGFRDSRNKNRLKFFIDAVGMENLVEAIKKWSGLEFRSSGECLVELEHFDAKYGKVTQKDGKFALHMVVPAGIFDGNSMIEIGELADIYGKGIRLSIDQNLYIVGIDKSDLDIVLESDVFKKYKNIDSLFFNNLISCAGSDTCQYGVIKGKSDAIKLSKELSNECDINDGKIRIYWSACVKGCGIHELGDIGLLGCKTKLDGKSVEGVDILLGGSLLNESREAHTLLRKIPLVFAKDFIKELVLEYKRLKKPNESFEKFFDRVLSNYSYSAIAFMMSYNRLAEEDKKLKIDDSPKTFGHEAFEIFNFGEKLYRSYMGELPYKLVKNFTPLEKSIKIKKDDTISQMINKMIDASEARAEVFTELLADLNQF